MYFCAVVHAVLAGVEFIGLDIRLPTFTEFQNVRNSDVQKAVSFVYCSYHQVTTITKIFIRFSTKNISHIITLLTASSGGSLLSSSKLETPFAATNPNIFELTLYE